jgi:hypothetical protein
MAGRAMVRESLGVYARVAGTLLRGVADCLTCRHGLTSNVVSSIDLFALRLSQQPLLFCCDET